MMSPEQLASTLPAFKDYPVQASESVWFWTHFTISPLRPFNHMYAVTFDDGPRAGQAMFYIPATEKDAEAAYEQVILAYLWSMN